MRVLVSYDVAVVRVGQWCAWCSGAGRAVVQVGQVGQWCAWGSSAGGAVVRVVQVGQWGR